MSKHKPDKPDRNPAAKPAGGARTDAGGRPRLWAFLRWAAVFAQMLLPIAFTAITIPALAGSSESRQSAWPLLVIVGLVGPWLVPVLWAIRRPTIRGPMLLGAASALLVWFAFPPAGLFPLGFVCLAPWCLMTRRTHSWLDWVIVTVAFLQSMLGGPACWLNYSTELGWAGMVVGSSGYYFLALVPLRLLVLRRGWGFTGPLAPMWVAVEYLRSLGSAAFPWVYIGHTQAGFTPFIQIADLAGAYGVSAVVLLVNGLAADVLQRRAELAGSAESAGEPAATGWLAWFPPVRLGLVGAAVAATLVYGAWRTADIDGTSEAGPLVLVIQTDIPQRVKDEVDGDPKARRKSRWKHYHDDLDLTREGAEKYKPDLIVWPETSVPFPLNVELLKFPVSRIEPAGVADEATVQQILRMREVAQQYGLAEFEEISVLGGGSSLLLGSPGYRPRQRENGEWELASRNSATLIEPQPGGDLKGYTKIHLVPWGEFIPGKQLFPLLYNFFVACMPYGILFELEAGDWDTYRPFELTAKPQTPGVAGRTYRFAVPICYEDTTPEVTGRLVYDEAGGGKLVDFLVNISNDGWFEGSSELEMHNDIARFRTVEHRVGMVRSVNRGVSGFLDPVGRFVARVRQGKTGADRLVPGALAERMVVNPQTTVYSRVGDVFARAMGLAAAVLAVFCVWRKTQKGV